MAVTHYNMRKQVEEFIKVAEKASFDAKRAHDRIDALPAVEPPAAPQKGERGPQGLPGKDAAPARDGRDAVGIQGPAGRAGRDCTCTSAAAIADAVRKLDAATTELTKHRAEVAKLQADTTALIEMHKNAGQYMEFLHARAAARIAKNNRLIASKAWKQ